MQIEISFRHMEPSETLREYADEKVRRVIRKHIRDDFDAQITLSVEKFRHIAKLHLSYKGIAIKCDESSEDMYQSIDLALDKFERQIRRYKGKLRSHKPAQMRQARIYDLAVLSMPDVDEIEEELKDEFAEMVEVQEKPRSTTKVLKHEKLSVDEMSVDSAMMKLSLEGAPLVVFVNEETNATCVLYRLGDGNYGMITVDRS